MAKPPYTTHSIHLRSFTPEQLLEVVEGAQFEHFILAKAKCNARLERWTDGNFTVDIGHYNFPVRAIGAFPSKRMCVGYMRQPIEYTWVNGFQVNQQTMEFYPLGSELNYRASANGEWVAIEFDEAALQTAARNQLGHEVDLPWQHIISFNVDPEERQTIDQMVRRLWKHPISGELMVQPILGAIAELLHNFQCKTTSATKRKWFGSQVFLDRADQYLRSTIATPFDIQALASAVGTVPRTLQRHFLHAYGMTPQEWARCQALHRVRSRLITSDFQKFTVAGIAAEYGFRHMGRFASYYSELFGEPPTATLRKTQLSQSKISHTVE